MKEHLIDGACPGPYQTVCADLDGDGRPDILVTCPGKGLIQWYQAPDWKKRAVISNLHEVLDFAPFDLDGDGHLELAVIHEFHLSPSTNGGKIVWLKRGRTLDEEWSVHPIDALPTAHRLRWARLGAWGPHSKRRELVVAPILGAGAQPKRERAVPAGLFYYRIPDDPAAGPWERHLIDDALPLQHGIRVQDINEDGLDEILSASAAGTHIYYPRAESGGLTFRKQQLHPAESSEVYWAPKGPRGGPMVATVEPWHGNMVCVYTPPAGGQGPWLRTVLDDTLADGHALWCADVDGDGETEILAGYRGAGTGLNLYKREDAEGRRWKKTVLDSHMACQGIFGAPLLSHRTDIVACGGSTNNVKLYENTGRP